jgi:hypothetical protein
MPKLKERILRLELTNLESILRTAGYVEKSEQLNDAHIEPGELVLRMLSENKGEED